MFCEFRAHKIASAHPNRIPKSDHVENGALNDGGTQQINAEGRIKCGEHCLEGAKMLMDLMDISENP